MGMTRGEFARIVKGLKAVYAYESFIGTQDAFDVWYELLKDLDYQAVSIGCKKLMQTSSRVPTPADIRKAAIPEEDISEGEVWATVAKAIGRSTYYASEEFAALPPDIQRSVGSAEQLHRWATTEDLSLEVVQSQVLRSYRLTKEQSRQQQLVDPNVAKLTQAVAAALLQS